MTSLLRRLCFALITISVVMVSARGDTVAQTPGAKSKATGSISVRVTLGGKAAAGIPVAAKVRPIRQDSALRAKVLRKAEASNKEIQFKPCERTTDYDLSYSPAPAPRQ